MVFKGTIALLAVEEYRNKKTPESISPVKEFAKVLL
jgi:hypothetical protein